MKKSRASILKRLGLVILKDGPHIKCKDKDNNVYIFSCHYLDQANDNIKFAKLTNKMRWLKNKSNVMEV